MIEKIALLAEWLAKSEYITAFTGAGISTASGIPDFRSPESGLWEKANPEKVASIYGFRHNPQAFFDWVRPLAEKTLAAEPNSAHKALYELEKLGKMRAVITQNIDMLHTRAGSSNVYELHGHMRTGTCIHCYHEFDGKELVEKLIVDGQVPHCSICGGLIKPNVILFGEQLPYEPLQNAKKAARDSDLMIIVGSSLEVAPASDIPMIAKRNGAKVAIINKDATELDRMVDLVIQGDCAEILPALLHCLETIS
jgi:NAD-dependent deacetylase